MAGVDHPPTSQVGSAFPIDLEQLDARSEKVIGGMDARIELVPAIRPRGPAKSAATRTTRDKPPPQVRAKRRR